MPHGSNHGKGLTMTLGIPACRTPRCPGLLGARASWPSGPWSCWLAGHLGILAIWPLSVQAYWAPGCPGL